MRCRSLFALVSLLGLAAQPGRAADHGPVAAGLCQLGYEAYRRGAYDLALWFFDEAIGFDPAYPEAHLGRGAVGYRKQEWDQAAHDYAIAVQIDWEQCRVYRGREDVPLNYQIWDRPAADGVDRPGLGDEYSLRALAGPDRLIRAGMSNIFLTNEIDPFFADCKFHVHDMTVFEGRVAWERIVTDESKAIRSNPTDGERFMNRAYARKYLGEIDMAVADYSEAIRLNPVKERAYYRRAELWRRKGEWEKAEDDFRTARVLGFMPGRRVHLPYIQLPFLDLLDI
jgi:Tfp pilus assembly protein PilF